MSYCCCLSPTVLLCLSFSLFSLKYHIQNGIASRRKIIIIKKGLEKKMIKKNTFTKKRKGSANECEKRKKK